MIGQRLVAIGAMLGTLGFAYLLERYLLGPARDRTADTFDTTALVWLVAASWILLAVCVVGLVGLVLGRARHDRVVSAVYLVVGAVIVLVWPIAVTIGWFPDWLSWLQEIVVGRDALVLAAGAFIAVLGAAALASRGRRGAY